MVIKSHVHACIFNLIMRVEQPSMVTDGGDHASHVAEIEKVDFLQIEKTTRGTKFNPKTFKWDHRAPSSRLTVACGA